MIEQNNNINSQQIQENEVKPQKRKRNWLFTLFACLMTGIIVVLAMNIGQNLSKGIDKKSSGSSNPVSDSNSNNDNTSNGNSNSNTNDTTKCDTAIIFDSTKSINNSNEKNYILASQGPAGIYATTDTTQKTLKFSFTPATVAKYYSLSWGNTAATTSKTDKIKFEKKIA